MNSVIVLCLVSLGTGIGTYGFLLTPNATQPKYTCKDLDPHGCAVNPDLCLDPILAVVTCPRTCNMCVDGVWGLWGQCDVSCGSGTRTRTRSCTNPPPAHGGDDCHGPSKETSNCTVANCQAADCSDLLHLNPTSTTGVYEVTTWNTSTKSHVYCDMDTEGGGWTVFQRRLDGHVDFHQNWDNYENGFGNVSGEFWLGLRLLHEMTSRLGGRTVMRLDAQAANGTTLFDAFNSFSVDPSPGYTAHVGTRNFQDQNYPVGGFDDINNMQFSTYDRDRDQWGGNCGQSYNGGWWYNECYSANPNGRYLTPGTVDPTSMNYVAYGGNWESLRTIKLMFR